MPLRIVFDVPPNANVGTVAAAVCALLGSAAHVIVGEWDLAYRPSTRELFLSVELFDDSTAVLCDCERRTELDGRDVLVSCLGAVAPIRRASGYAL